MNPPLTFVDTNILVYGHTTGDQDARAVQARKLLTELWETGSGALSTQVLQEFSAVSTRKAEPPLPKHTARAVVAKYSEWCTIDTDPLLLVSAGKLEEEHALALWDALVIEAALRSGATTLLSEDLQHGRRFGELTIENPFRDQ